MDSTSTIDEIATAQQQKETTANEWMRASSPSGAFGRRGAAASGLSWTVYGTARWYINATATAKANSAVTLTGSSAGQYVSINRSLTVAQQASVFPPAEFALYKVVTSASAPTSWEDHRDPHHLNRFLYGRITINIVAASTTLTYEQAMCDSIEFTGLAGVIIVPTIPRNWTIYNNTSTGSPSAITIKTSGGSGIDVGQTKRAILECDGTNVVRLTADV